MKLKHLLCVLAALVVFANPLAAFPRGGYHGGYHRSYHGGHVLLGVGAGLLIGGAIIAAHDHYSYGTVVVGEDPPNLYSPPEGYTYQQRDVFCNDAYGRNWVCRRDWVLVPLN